MSKSTYVSETTEFLKSLKEKDPSLEVRQRAGRARYWDKELDFDLLKDLDEGAVPQKPYVYQTE